MLPPSLAGEAVDRRRRPRLKLAYPLRLCVVSSGSWIETKTEDLSCEGFFCFTESVLSLRDKVECELIIPADEERPTLKEDIVLHCRAEVVRVVRRTSDSSFGVGFRISDYTIDREVAKHELVMRAFAGNGPVAHMSRTC